MSNVCSSFIVRMAVLKKDVKRITISIPKNILEELSKHLSNFALTERSSWILESIREKMAKEKQMLMEEENSMK